MNTYPFALNDKEQLAMHVFHVTRKAVHGDIVRDGIDPAYSQGKMRVSWFVTERMLPWAVLHVMRKFKLPLGEVICFECLVPKRYLTKRRRGIYTTTGIVEPLALTDLQTGEDVAAYYPGDWPRYPRRDC